MTTPFWGYTQIHVSTTGVTSCNTANGKATITVNNAAAGFIFEYAVDGNYSNTNTFENLTAGNHTATVRDKNTKCEFSKNFTIEDNNNLKLNISGTGFHTYCVNQSGQATLTATASGGSGNYSYSWPGGTKVVSSTGWYSVTVTDDSTGCTKSTGGLVIFVPVICSRDPNDIIGPVGYGIGKMVSKFVQWPYTIRFENDPDFATAPAQVVKITDPLDSNLNILSFRLGDFGFGGFIFTVPPNRTYYSARLDVIDSLGVVVDVTAGIDITKKEAFWIFESKDPATGLPPTNPLLGFLPVNDSLTHKGEGFVNYTIKPASHTHTGDTVHALASIVFDINAPIATPAIFNTIDAESPVSHVGPLPAVIDTNALLVKWSGMDDVGGSGVRFYDLFVSENDAPYQAYQSGITDTSTIFIGRYGNTYDFYSIATDNTGNREAVKLNAEQRVIIRSNLVKPNLGSDTTLRKCPGTPVNLNSPFNLTGLYAVWNTPTDTAQVTPGIFTLIANSSNGLKDTAFVTVIDYEKPALGNDTTVGYCSNLAADISNVYNTAGYASVQWSTPNPDSVSTGTYTLIVANTFGCKDTAVVTVIINPKPNLGSDTSVSVCAGSTTSIRNIYDTTGYTSVQWSTTNPDSVGAGVYTLIVSNIFGCKDTAAVTVLVGSTPNAVATPSSQNACSGSPITTINITGNLGNSADYNWTRDNTITVTGIAASGTGNISGTLVNNTTAPETVTFTITPSFTNGGVTCTGTPITATVIVKGPPTISCPGNIALNNTIGQCGRVVSYSTTATGIPAPTITYAFTGATIVSGSGNGSGSFFNVGVTNVAVTAINICGTSSCSFTVTITDAEPPSITYPGPITVSCAPAVPAPDPGSVVASDNCPGVVVTHIGDVISAQTCSNRYTITRTYRATDAANNFTECIQIITVNDQTAPTLTCPGPVTVSCASAVPAPNIALVTGVSDNCTGVVTITHQGDVISGQTCNNRYTITRTYRATDVCGNFAECIQIITVNDQTAPTLTCPGPVTVSCASAVPAPNIGLVTGVSDNCAGVVTITHQSDVISGQTCDNRYIITRTYRATDVCSNFAECTQIITVNDQTAPTLTCPGPVTVSCASAVPAPNIAFVTGVSDNCAGVVTVTHQGDVISAQTCANRYTITRTYRATDVCGNFAECTQIITVNDQTAPTLTCPGPVTVSCASAVPAPNIASVTGVSDNCAGVITVTHQGDVISGQTCANRYTITRTYRATDVCGNFTECTQIITVNDQTAPTLTCPGPVTVSCASAVLAPDITSVTGVSDNCAGVVTVTHQGDVISGQTCPNRYTITRTYRATDVCGNFAECIQIITVNDQTAPTLTCPGPVTVSCASAVPAPDITSVTGVSDNCAGVVTVTHQGDVISGQTCPNRYTITRTYRATDVCGNFTECIQIITVNDQTPPVIVCPQNITATTPIGSCTAVVIYTVTATDNCAGAITIVSVPASGSAFPIGVTTVTSTATDVCGNSSTCTFTITVIDGQLPVITTQPANKTVCAGAGTSFNVVSTNAVSYQWQAWNGSVWNNIAGANSSSFTVNNITLGLNTNSYRVIVIGLCTNVTSNPATLYVNALPTISLSASPTLSLLPTQTTTITATVNPAGGSFVWIFNGSPLTGITGPSIGPLTVDGVGAYHAIYTDLNGCVSTSSDIVVSPQISDNLYIYPNPNTGHFHIRFYNQANEEVTVRIFDMKAVQVYLKKVKITRAYTDIEVELMNDRITSGETYVVEVRGSGGRLIGSKKMVIFK